MGIKTEVIEKSAFATVELPNSGFAFTLPFTMGKMFKTLMSNIESKFYSTDAFPYTRYYGVDIAKLSNCSFLGQVFFKFDYSVGIPVTDAGFDFWSNNDKSSKLGFSTKKISQAKYLKTLHVGAYKNLAKTHSALTNYMLKNKLKYLDEILEIYIDDPSTTPKDKLRTEIYYKTQ